jgi:DeoR/GlpR family transcriptional regulator of sugar metabolism
MPESAMTGRRDEGWSVRPQVAIRLRAILAAVRANGRFAAKDLADLLRVSPETVRRDLRWLEAQGLVSRSYGVVFPVEAGNFESSLAERSQRGGEEKQRIAEEAVRRLGETETIFIDEGFNPLLFARSLPADRPLTVVTTSLPAASILATRTNTDVMMIGGRVRGRTLGVVESWAVGALATLHLDLAVMGANGVSPSAGMTTPDPAVADVKRAAMAAARHHIFIGAHYKFGVTSLVQFAALGDFDVVVTGRELRDGRAEKFTAAGASLVRV